MNTNFFNQIAQMDIDGDLHMTISKGAENRLIVSVMLQNEQCADSAKKIIPPLNLRGTAEELDEGFFTNITAPLQTVSGLLVDMASFMKQVGEAKKNSAMSKGKAEKETSEADKREKKYRDAMAKADELEKEGKPQDAWMKVPNPSDYPEYVDEIRKRKAELSDQFAPPSLFASQKLDV